MTRSLFSKLLLLVGSLFLLLTPVTAQADSVEDAKAAILACYESGSERVDLSAYHLDSDTLASLYDQLERSGQLPWYAGHYRYVRNNDGQVLQFIPELLDETIYRRDLYEQRIAEILNETVLPGMSQWQKALSIHDYLVSHAAYDETYDNTTGYDLLVKNSSTCQGYSQAYLDLMTRVGIPCVLVSSREMDHCWNLVQIDGNWYHVDVTWDDPISNRHGRVMHTYFLISDQVISDQDHEHSGWETDIICNDTRFDSDVFWQNITSQICYLDDSTSYLCRLNEKTYNIYRRNEETAELTWIADTKLSYFDLGNGRLGYHYNGLSLWNDRLYYCDSEKVYSCDLDGNDRRVEFAADCDAWDKVIVGCFTDQNTISITMLGAEKQLTHIQVPTTDHGGHSHDYAVERTEATCTTAGTAHFSCDCGVQYQGTPLEPLGHVFDEGFTILEASWEHSGEILYTCTLCDETKYEEIPQLPQPELTLKLIWNTGNFTQRLLLVLVGVFALLGLGRIFKKKK